MISSPAPAPAAILFPATAALMLGERTYMSGFAVTMWLHNYGRRGEKFFVKSRQPGNHHYLVTPAPAGFCIVPCRMAPGTPAGFVLA